MKVMQKGRISSRGFLFLSFEPAPVSLPWVLVSVDESTGIGIGPEEMCFHSGFSLLLE